MSFLTIYPNEKHTNQSRTPATNLRVRLGDYNLKGQTELYPHEEFTVRRKVVNENYNPATYQNDIALLELSEEVVYRQHIIPVCLPSRSDNFTGKSATATGWGRTQVRTRHYLPCLDMDEFVLILIILNLLNFI